VGDFDDLLERLVLEPEFKAALAADPDHALAGYQLDADERELLMSQVFAGTGVSGRVEERISKAGMAGLLSALHEGAGPHSVSETLDHKGTAHPLDSRMHEGHLKGHTSAEHKQILTPGHKAVADGGDKKVLAEGETKMPPTGGEGKMPAHEGISKMPAHEGTGKLPASEGVGDSRAHEGAVHPLDSRMHEGELKGGNADEHKQILTPGHKVEADGGDRKVVAEGETKMAATDGERKMPPGEGATKMSVGLDERHSALAGPPKPPELAPAGKPPELAPAGKPPELAPVEIGEEIAQNPPTG
jgi:hypothetical protein